MTGRERVRRAVGFEHPDRVPRDLWALPGVEMFRKAELDEVRARFPPDITRAESPYARADRERGTPCVVGSYSNLWGATWQVGEPGVIGEVKHPPLADWSALDSYEMPWEVLNRADWDRVNRSCAATDLFVVGSTQTHPFEVMQFLRGSANLFLDLGYQPKQLGRLRDRLHEFMLRDIELWAKTDVDAIALMDDWGTQRSLLISPDLWRSFFKPLYRDYFDAIHARGKFAFFHSDGYIRPILNDLVEIGVDALNSQLFCMDIEEIGRSFRGRLTFWGEIDRQYVLPFGLADEVREAVRRVRRALDDGRGGVIAQCEFGNDVPKENILAVFEAWRGPRGSLSVD